MISHFVTSPFKDLYKKAYGARKEDKPNRTNYYLRTIKSCLSKLNSGTQLYELQSKSINRSSEEQEKHPLEKNSYTVWLLVKRNSSNDNN